MHEFSIVNSILEAALAVSREHGDLPILRVELEVGALRQVVPEALTFAFEASIPGTLAAGAVLEWTEIPARVACPGCGRVYLPPEVFWRCPACGAAGGQVLEGEELVLKSVTLDGPDEAASGAEGVRAWK